MLAFFLTLLLAPAPAQADQVKFLPHPLGALAGFQNAIESAKSSIDLLTFILTPCDASTQVLFQSLEKKAEQGVRVRVILDSTEQGATDKQRLASYFAAHGIEVKWYNTSLLNVNFRSHIKLLVADDKRYITGGRNWADEYFGLSDDFNFVDRDVYVSGSSAREAGNAFDLVWNSRKSQAAQNATAFAGWGAICKAPKKKLAGQVSAYLAAHSAAVLRSMPTRTCGNVRFVADRPGATILHSELYANYIQLANRNGKLATAAYLEFLKGTRQKLLLENWAFMPHEAIKYELFNLRWNHIPVLAFTNDNMDAPGILKYAESYYNTAASELQTKGTVQVIQISMHGNLDDTWALSPGKVRHRLHGKLAVRDNRDVLVGSFNIDERSTTQNMESMMIAKDCPALAADVTAPLKDLQKVFTRDVRAGVAKNEVTNPLWQVFSFMGHSFF